MHKPGEVVLVQLQFTDTFEIKTRPAVVLFEEFGNVIVAGITSNLKMKGIPLTKKDGAIKNSVIKPNYIFTVSDMLIKKKLFNLPESKKKLLYKELNTRIKRLI